MYPKVLQSSDQFPSHVICSLPAAILHFNDRTSVLAYPSQVPELVNKFQVFIVFMFPAEYNLVCAAHGSLRH